MENLSFVELLRPYSDDVCLLAGQGMEAQVLSAQLKEKVGGENLCEGSTVTEALALLQSRSHYGADVIYADLRGTAPTDLRRFLEGMPELLNAGGRAIVLVSDSADGAPLRSSRGQEAFSAIEEEELGTGCMLWVRRALEGC